MEKNVVLATNEIPEAPVIQDLVDSQLAFVGGGIGETIL